MTTVDNILKEVYEDGGIHDQLQTEITALKRIEKSSEGVTHEVGGKYVRFPIRTKRNHGIGARNESEALPIAQSQSYESAQVKLKNLYGAIQLTGQTFELADKNFQAFASALDQEVSSVKETLRKDVARQVYGTGKGVMATATGAGTTTTFVTTNTQYLEVGMFVDIFTSADANRVADVTITDITGNTVTFSPAAGVATATGDYITRDNSVGKEITGLGAIISTSATIYNVNPATVPVWKATVSANGGVARALTESLMIQQIDIIRQKGGGVPTVIFTSLGVRRSYFALLQSQRRIVNNSNFEGGFSGLAFTVDSNDIPLISDVDCPPSTMKFVNEKELKWYNAGDWSFMNRDGSNWQRVINSSGSFDAYQATLYQYAELGTHRRNAHADLQDLIES